MTATVNIKGIAHFFDEFQALAHIDLTIPAGSYAVLLGPSGCGKTTLLSILGGFLTPSAGSICLDGMDITHLSPARRTTTTMFQDYALFPHMSILDNVGFGLRMHGHKRRARHEKAHELLSMVGLESSALHKPHQLSGGQRQRVALARALAVEPDVLLLDEPLGALDLKLRRQMQDELKHIQERVGTTFIHVTHDQEEAMAIADQIIVMNAGKIEDTGTPESIYLRPSTRFAATFMGEANQIDGCISEKNAAYMFVLTPLGKLQIPLKADVNNSLQTGDPVNLFFRPEQIMCGPVKPADVAEPRVSGDYSTGTSTQLFLGDANIIEHAFLGTHYRCRLMVQEGLCFTANVAQYLDVQKGQQLPLSVDPQWIVAVAGDQSPDQRRIGSMHETH